MPHELMRFELVSIRISILFSLFISTDFVAIYLNVKSDNCGHTMLDFVVANGDDDVRKHRYINRLLT